METLESNCDFDCGGQRRGLPARGRGCADDPYEVQPQREGDVKLRKENGTSEGLGEVRHAEHAASDAARPSRMREHRVGASVVMDFTAGQAPRRLLSIVPCCGDALDLPVHGPGLRGSNDSTPRLSRAAGPTLVPPAPSARSCGSTPRVPPEAGTSSQGSTAGNTWKGLTTQSWSRRHGALGEPSGAKCLQSCDSIRADARQPTATQGRRPP